MKNCIRYLLLKLAGFAISVVNYIVSRFVALGISFALFAITMLFLVSTINFYNEPINFDKKNQYIEIKPGYNIDSLTTTLSQRKIIKNPIYFKILARATNKATQLKVGEYQLTAEMRPKDILNLVTSGRVLQYSFTIIDGWTFKQLRKALENDPNLSITLRELSDQEIMNKLGYPDLHPEGRFLPDTYFFPKNYSDLEVLKRSFNGMKLILTKAWENRDPNLPIKSTDELLTLASIVEKETGVAFERPKIAGVFLNRLTQKMKLQTDPTVIYGLGDQYKGVILKSHLITDTPYNTYTRYGLPPTPIAMPSKASVFAVVNPFLNGDLFFVAKGDKSGEHVFSKTLKEHNEAVKAYRRLTNNND